MAKLSYLALKNSCLLEINLQGSGFYSSQAGPFFRLFFAIFSCDIDSLVDQSPKSIKRNTKYLCKPQWQLILTAEVSW